MLKVLSPLFFLITQSVVFGNYILLPLGYKKTYTLLPVFAALIHIFTCSILTYKFGAIGGALSILMIEILTFLIYIRILFNTKIIYEWLKV
uniref:polysaccharide biosynthesis C-terminal domain-containing protein n=1 Tax=Shewanella marina TaxID=487319 RepID=UPI00068626A8